MNAPVKIETLKSACPHDCPSTCALEIEVIGGEKIGRVRGAKANTYTDGVICAKVARYAERLYHPDRLLKPVVRKGAKGAGELGDISWNDALDVIAEKFIQATEKHGSESVWTYFYAGTMGLIQRDSIERLTNAKDYSRQFGTICVNSAWSGFSAGTGKLMGPDPREMAKSDCVVLWGTNPVSTQVNVMTHAIKARKQRGAKIVAVDVYMNDTMKQADMALLLRPGTDGALACAVMHVLFRDNLADRKYLKQFSDLPDEFESHLQSRTPEWAADITGLSADEIEAFAHLLGRTPKSYLRLGYGFTRSRNGAVNMHAASCIATVQGSWQHEGGGAFHSNGEIFGLNSDRIKGTAYLNPQIRTLDQSKIGRVLTGDTEALYDGPPVTAMLVQNTNPATVAPEQAKVREGLMREDLFLAVHEHFMTETAALADLVIPATMFVEHDDIYRAGGQQSIVLGPKLVDGPSLCRSNFFVIEELAKRLGVSNQEGFGLTEKVLIDDLLQTSGRGSLAEIQETGWIDCQPPFEESHYINGFEFPDGKFRFSPDWSSIVTMRPPENMGLQGKHSEIPTFPDYWPVTQEVTKEHPYRLATSPSRSFLNTTFNETKSSRKREGIPKVLIHPATAQKEGVEDGQEIRLINEQGEVKLMAELFDGVKADVLIVEGLHKNTDHTDGVGINTLIAADSLAPHGGVGFHDCRVRLEKV